MVKIVGVEREDSGAGFVSVHGDRAIVTVGIASPASEGRAGIGDWQEGHRGAVVVGVHANCRCDRAAASAADHHGQIMRIEGEGGGACSGCGHCNYAIVTIGVTAPTGEGGIRTFNSRQGHHDAVGVVFGAIRSAVDASRVACHGASTSASLGYTEDIRSQGEVGGAGFVSIHGDRAVRAVGIASPASEGRAGIGECRERHDGAVVVGVVPDGWRDCAAASAADRYGQIVGVEREDGGAGFIGIHGDRAIRAVGIASPAGEGRAGIGDWQKGHHSAVIIGVDPASGSDRAAAGAGDRHGQVVRVEGEGGGASLVGIHGDRAIVTVGIASPASEGRAGIGDWQEGHHRAVVIGVNPDGRGDRAAASAADRHGQVVGVEREDSGAGFVSIHGDRAVRAVGIASPASEGVAGIGVCREGHHSAVVIGVDPDGGRDCAAAGNRHGQVVRIEGEGGGAGLIGIHSDRAIGAVGIASPAIKGIAGIGVG